MKDKLFSGRPAHRFRTASVIAAFTLGVTALQPAQAARELKIAGYCWVGDSYITYSSAVFQDDSDSMDRDNWTDDFKDFLRKQGAELKGMGGTCRGWRGGASAVQSALEAQAADRVASSKSSYNSKYVAVDWVPEDTFPASGRRSTVGGTMAKGPATETRTASRTGPASRPATSKYVDVQGPNGVIRLSPEVAARNQAAADDYRRKREEHARATANHQRKLALHQQSIVEAAARRREYEQRLAANANEVANHNTAMQEHRKLAAKPPGVNAVYRGFGGRTCDQARRSATQGSGTSSGTRFVEVTEDLSGMPRWCIVQGWWWNTSKVGSSRQ